MITVRRAGPLDARPLSELLNEIIAEGSTTAIATPFTTDGFRTFMTRNPDKSAWHLAEDETGLVVGFQWIEPVDYLPEEAVEIATFARIGKTGLGIGSALFRETTRAAKALGYLWINANIRADNTSGLTYYQSRGFEDYATITGYKMSDGRVVDKILKRYDL